MGRATHVAWWLLDHPLSRMMTAAWVADDDGVCSSRPFAYNQAIGVPTAGRRQHGFHRQVQRPLLERRRPGGRPEALRRVAARDLRGAAAGAAGDRSLRPGVSRR